MCATVDGRKTRYVRKSVLAIAAAAVTVTLAGCAGSTSAGTGTSGSPGPSSTGTSTSGSSADTASGLQAAVAAAEAAERAPAKLNVLGPLKSKPPTGKTLVFTQCEIDQCQYESLGFQAAAAALGWNYKVVHFQSSNPATLVSALNQALQYHPVAVATTGVAESLWSSVVPAYKKAGIPILTFAVAPVPAQDVLADENGPADNYKYGQMIGDWFVADSKGKGHALLVTVNEFTILKSFTAGFESAVKASCPACNVTTMDEPITAAENGQLVSATVSALQKDPSIGYAISVDGPFFTGLPAALAAAGLSHRVKIASQGGDTDNLADVKTGKEAATTGDALTIGAWLEIDALLRHLEGMPLPPENGSNLPTQLMVTGGNFQIATSYPEPSDYASELKKLWHL